MLIALLWDGPGNLAEWIASGVALLALFVASAAAVFTYRTNVAQQQTLRSQQRQYEEAQASQVSFWIENDETQDHAVAVNILNSSDAPVYGLALLAEYPIEAVWYQEVVMPTAAEPLRVQITDEWTQVPNRLMFRDKLGNHWFRSLYGQLQQQKEEEVRPSSFLVVNHLMGFTSRSDPPADYQGRSWDDWPKEAPK